MARTDEAGFYRFAGLDPGEYGGLVDAGEGRATHESQPLAVVSGQYRPIVLKAGEKREINVALPRTHAVRVRVVDEWGDPLSDLRVIAQAAGAARQPPFGLRTTDDHGRIRIFGLRPGNYLLCADAGRFRFSDGANADPRRESLVRTCYPSAVDETEAASVPIDGLTSPGEVTITMRRGRTFTVSGRVLDTLGAPPAGATISLAQFWTSGSGARSVRLDPDGRFRLTNVLPGDYAIQASLVDPELPDHQRPREAAFVPLHVDASDVEDLVVQMQRGVEVAGRVVLEDPAIPLPPSPGSGLMVSARLADDRLPGSGSSRISTVAEDRLFKLSGMFGRRTLEFMNVPRGWHVKSVRYGIREILDEATEFKAGGEPSGLLVILSNRGASITGRVVDDRGGPVAGARVFMFRAGASGPDRRWPSDTVASEAGEFRLGPMRAGDYLIVALPSSTRSLQMGEWDRIARFASLAERVTLGELDERTVELRVVTER